MKRAYAQSLMSKFIYPVDTDQFLLIREQGKVYVDKTDLTYASIPYDIITKKE